MRAHSGDALLVRGHHVGEQDRQAVIIEVHGHDGEPPYVVRWEDGHESVFFPSCDAFVSRLSRREGDG
ncbi:DUF1918 domain-containing protein [Actinomadura sp. DC4]|uniref:DUF1918 domain-containing protein n=1 Tax=Actinomadura sp. DC4 TaxID=3055069 RepID=UPI0025AF726C|nr:DUF1918 domain-containing protein [Actinomadura sp. DC4]MDN3352962.1 DUF1918 domain-containing protein [Actinomadura sp. DC4]